MKVAGKVICFGTYPKEEEAERVAKKAKEDTYAAADTLYNVLNDVLKM